MVCSTCDTFNLIEFLAELAARHTRQFDLRALSPYLFPHISCLLRQAEGRFAPSEGRQTEVLGHPPFHPRQFDLALYSRRVFPQPLGPEGSRVSGGRGERLQEFSQPLGAFFQKSRDRWRAHAAEKQTKLRALETRVRDLERSRSKWRERAQQAEQALRAVTEGKPSERSGGGVARDGEADAHAGEYLARGEPAPRARGHGYDPRWVEMALLQRRVGLCSLRGTCRMLWASREAWGKGALPLT